MLDTKSKIHIVGGTGAMGTWLRVFLESLDYSVSISDEKKAAENIEEKDLFFISVPIEKSSVVISDISKQTKKDCLIVDLSSLMELNSEVLKNCDRPAMSLHFLFGPTVSSIKNQKVIYKSYKADGAGYDLLDIFKTEGAHIIEMDSKNHDFQMAHVQSLTHFINLCFAKTLIDDKIGLRGDI